MGKAIDLGHLEPSDGIDEQARRKINSNFENIASQFDPRYLASQVKGFIDIPDIPPSAPSSSSYPPIGSYMYCDSNPESAYPGTKWERMREGTILMSSGSTYPTGSTYFSIQSRGYDGVVPSVYAAPLWHRMA